MLKIFQAGDGEKAHGAGRDSDLLRLFLFAAGAGFIVMTGTIFYAISTGDLSVEGPALLEMSWGLVSLVDIYLGLILFSSWVLWREQFSLNGLAWVFFINTLGNMVSCLYVIRAAYLANGNMTRFWLGNTLQEDIAR